MNWIGVFFALPLTILPTLAQASCRNYAAEQSGDIFSFTYVCESSFGSPSYTIVRNITESVDLQVLEFAPREIGLVCERYETPTVKRADCRQRKPLAGSVFEGLFGTFSILDFGPSFSKRFEEEFIFRYPMSSLQAESIGCAILLRHDGAVNMWISDDLHSLSECLIRLELDLVNHPQLLLKKR